MVTVEVDTARKSRHDSTLECECDNGFRGCQYQLLPSQNAPFII